MFRTICWTLCALLMLAFVAVPLFAADDVLSAAPTAVRQLLKTGGVTLEAYDPASEQSDIKNYHGSVLFELSLATPFDVEFHWQQDGTGNKVSIEAVFQPVEAKITHRIRVPERLNHAEFWNDPLVRHELDHVAISSDPRTILLFGRMLKPLASLERKLKGNSIPKLSGVSAVVNSELRLRREAVYELIRHQNHKLDRETQHGAVPLADREGFFRELYEKSSLHEAAFPFLADVLSLLKEKAYREAVMLHLVATDFAASPEPAK